MAQHGQVAPKLGHQLVVRTTVVAAAVVCDDLNPLIDVDIGGGAEPLP
ncbi:hypothetical protein AB0B85_21000 [Micromonospora sp. NPDC049044]